MDKISYDHLKEADLYQRKLSDLTDGGRGGNKNAKKDSPKIKILLSPLPEAKEKSEDEKSSDSSLVTSLGSFELSSDGDSRL